MMEIDFDGSFDENAVIQWNCVLIYWFKINLTCNSSSNNNNTHQISDQRKLTVFFFTFPVFFCIFNECIFIWECLLDCVLAISDVTHAVKREKMWKIVNETCCFVSIGFSSLDYTKKCHFLFRTLRTISPIFVGPYTHRYSLWELSLSLFLLVLNNVEYFMCWPAHPSDDTILILFRTF